MRKIICIGECSLNVVFDTVGRPIGSMPGGRIVQAAAMLGRKGRQVIMATDTGADPVGDIIVGFLERAGVDVRCVDRYTDGRTALNVTVIPSEAATPSATSSAALPSLTRYEQYPEEAFDIIWPRIDPGDIVLFGGHYAIDRRMRERMSKLLAHAVERKAIMIYLPGFLPQQQARITRVMPEILENMEIAHLIITRNKDLQHIFGTSDAADCYAKHISFYCRDMINVDADAGTINYFCNGDSTSAAIPSDAHTMMWNAGATAGIVDAIADVADENLDLGSDKLRQDILSSAVRLGSETADLSQPNSLSADGPGPKHISSYIL
ncbi:MAG: hypothetical protein K2M55_00910 [Muribaculaceae bacterium]|nr:hypothetical protein [Muribaculaceae bacterium]